MQSGSVSSRMQLGARCGFTSVNVKQESETDPYKHFTIVQCTVKMYYSNLRKGAEL